MVKGKVVTLASFVVKASREHEARLIIYEAKIHALEKVVQPNAH
jgi:hypothetical protein